MQARRVHRLTRVKRPSRDALARAPVALLLIYLKSDGINRVQHGIAHWRTPRWRTTSTKQVCRRYENGAFAPTLPKHTSAAQKKIAIDRSGRVTAGRARMLCLAQGP